MVLVQAPGEVAVGPERNSVSGHDPQHHLIPTTPALRPPWPTMSAPAKPPRPLVPDGSILDRTPLTLPWSDCV